jgi:chromosome segregation ATPase
MLTVKRAVHVIAIATPLLKQQLLAEVDAALENLQLQMQQLEFQQRRAATDWQNNVHKLVEARKEMEQAKEQHDNMQRELTEQREQIENLPEDTLVARGELETSVVLAPGDSISEKMTPVELILKDDVIVEIRGA